MKAKFFAPVAAVAVMAFAPMTAHAITGYTDDSTSMRAGPGGDYPRITRVPRNVRVEVHGCIRRYDWCDVSYRGARGWIDADEVKIPYRDRRGYVREYGAAINLPIISFSFDNYWDRHYRGNGFYRERTTWRERSRGWYNDQDRDGIPNRVDRDQDGDGIRNSQDRDQDGDGIRNSRDRDRDGDGIRDKRDRQPNTPN